MLLKFYFFFLASSEKALKVGQRTNTNNGSGNTKPTSTPTSTNIASSTVTSPPCTVTSTSNANTVSSTTSAESRKSPPGSAVSSPRPPSGGSKASADKCDSDNEEVKSESSTGAPKVPPLKIVLAPCSLSEQETSSLNGKNGSNRQLPYVVNSSSSSNEEKDGASLDSGKETLVAKVSKELVSLFFSREPKSEYYPRTCVCI